MKLKIITGILFMVVIAIASCKTDDQLEFSRYYSAGSVIYQTKCQNCHGAHGEGLQGLIPPLTDTAYLKSNKALLACIIKNGQKGKLIIANRTYEGEMPANSFSNVELAEIITYITNSFGNKLSTSTSLQVELDLKNCK